MSEWTSAFYLHWSVLCVLSSFLGHGRLANRLHLALGSKPENCADAQFFWKGEVSEARHWSIRCPGVCNRNSYSHGCEVFNLRWPFRAALLPIVEHVVPISYTSSLDGHVVLECFMIRINSTERSWICFWKNVEITGWTSKTKGER